MMLTLGGRSISEDDLRKVEVKMAELAKQNNPYVRKPIPKAEAVNYFTEKGMNINWICCKGWPMEELLSIHREPLLTCVADLTFLILVSLRP